MRIEFASHRLRVLYVEEKGAEKLPRAVVTQFFKVMQTIEAAHDERDLYALKSLHFEALKGQRANTGEHSLRLNDQYRLIVTLEERDSVHIVVIHSIQDYH